MATTLNLKPCSEKPCAQLKFKENPFNLKPRKQQKHIQNDLLESFHYLFLFSYSTSIVNLNSHKFTIRFSLFLKIWKKYSETFMV